MEFYFDDEVYLAEAKLGSGRYGTVWAVQAKNDPKVRRAVKIYSLKDEDKLNEELATLEKLAPNDPDKLIVRSFGKGKSEDGEPCLLMELAEGKPFYRLAQELRETQKEKEIPSEFNELLRIRLVVQVCKALDIALSLKIALTDLKLDNFFCEEKNNELVVKVVDWNIVDTKQPEVAFREETMPRLASAFYELFTGNSLEISPRVVDRNLLGLKQLGQSWPDYWCNLTFETRSILYEMAFEEWKDGERSSLQLWRRWEAYLQFWEQKKAESYRRFLSDGIPVGEIQNISMNDLLTSIDIFRLDRIQKVTPDNLNLDSKMLLLTQDFIANLVRERNFQRASIELRSALRIWPGNFLLATWHLFVRLGEVKPSASMYLIHIHPLTTVIESLWRTQNYLVLAKLLEDVREKVVKNWSDSKGDISKLVEMLLGVAKIYLAEQEFEKAIQANDNELARLRSGDIVNLLMNPQHNIFPFLNDKEFTPPLEKILGLIKKFPVFLAATEEIKKELVKDFVDIDAWRVPETSSKFKQMQEDIKASLRVPRDYSKDFEEQNAQIEKISTQRAKILNGLSHEIDLLIKKHLDETDRLKASSAQIENTLSSYRRWVESNENETKKLSTTPGIWVVQLKNASEDMGKVTKSLGELSTKIKNNSEIKDFAVVTAANWKSIANSAVDNMDDAIQNIEKLTEKINDKTLEKETLLNTVNDWNSELTKAENNLNNANILIGQLHDGNERLIEDTKNIVELLAAPENEELSTHKKGDESLAFLLMELENLVEKRKESVASLVKEIQIIKESYVQLSLDVTKIVDSEKSIEDGLVLLDRKIKDLAKNLADLLPSVGKLENIISNARSRLVGVDNHLRQSRRVISRFETRIARLEKNILSLEDTRINQLGEMVSKTQTNFGPVRENALNLWKNFRQVKAVANNVANKSKDFDRIPDDIDDIQKTYENAKKRLKKLILKHKELGISVEDTSPKATDLKISYLQLTEIKIGSLEEKLQLAKKLIKNIDVDDTDTDLQEYQQKVNIISADFDTLKKRFLEIKNQDAEINTIQHPQQDLEQLFEKIEACANQLLSLIEVLLRIIVRPVSVIVPDPDLREKVRLLEERLTQTEIDIKSLIFSLGNRVDILSQKIDREFTQWKTWRPRIISGFLITMATLIAVGYFGVTLPQPTAPTPDITPTPTVTQTAVPPTEEASPTPTGNAISTPTPTSSMAPIPTPISDNGTKDSLEFQPITGIFLNTDPLVADPLETSRLARDKNGSSFNPIAKNPITVIGRSIGTSYLLVTTENGLAWMQATDGSNWSALLDNLPEITTCVYGDLNGEDSNLRVKPEGDFVEQNGSPVSVYKKGTFIVQGIEDKRHWIQLKIGEILGWLPLSSMSLCSLDALPTVTP